MSGTRWFSLLVFVVASAVVSWSQSTASGTVAGTITDQSGAVVADAQVKLTGTATGTSRNAATDSSGHYIFVNVDPGYYNLTAVKTGFATSKTSGEVRVGTTTTLNLALQVGGTTTIVEVQASNTELQTLNATIGNTVGSDMLQSLPSLGRDVSSFVTMQPGVSPDGSVGGTVVDQANFMLDGGNNSNDMDGSGGVYNPSFGDDPAASALDPYCRAHDHPNMFVVDASFMPSSAAVNPALTIAAQALRVADHIVAKGFAA